MKKTRNIKAKHLMVDDHLKIGGMMYRITWLTLTFGRKNRNRVSITLVPIEDTGVTTLRLNMIKPSHPFTIYNQ